MPGEGAARGTLFLVGEAPGREEDRQGRPFRGAAGKVLDDALRRAGIARERTFITNAVKCRPPGNRKPRGNEMATCKPYLLAQLAIVRPRVVVALGRSAAWDVLGPSRPFPEARGRWGAFGTVPVLATYHPAAVLYNRRLFPTLVADLRKARRRAEAG